MLFDYTSVTAGSLSSDIDDATESANAEIDALIGFEGDRTFENTVGVLERVGADLAISYGRGPFLGNASPDEAICDAARAAEEKLSKWGVELVFRDDLYEAVKSYAGTPAAAGLTGEDQRVLEFTMRDFLMAGHELDPEARAELKALSERLVELGVEFSRNIAEYEDFLVVTRADLEGMPDEYLEQLKPGEKEGTYLVSLSYPDVVPLMENASKRDIRKALNQKFLSRAADKNRGLLEETIEIRRRVADIFGLPSWAHHRMQEKMAKNPETVETFYNSIVPALSDKAEAEIARMAKMLESDTGVGALQLWDWRYYDTQLRKSEYGVDNAEVAKYFPLEQVIAGMLDLTGRMFGVDYQQIAPTMAWHQDVTLWKVADRASGELIGHFFMDLFPREGKFSHAAAWPLVPAHEGKEGFVKPVSAILANFTKPTADRPSLLQHTEVVTLFHEFGHILHMTFSKTRYVRFSGAGTEWDFVEAPSQIMEHWCWKPEILSEFARHHETGEPIPVDLVDQLAAARDLNQGIVNLRQVSFGKLDMFLHGPGQQRSIDEALEESMAISLFPLQEGTFFPASFGHLYGYDAGYYGYLWAEVFGDDMFSRFENEGITNSEVGMSYRKTVLEPNGGKDAYELLRDFLGREPNSDAFLRKLGIG